jgi:site-specific DNA recombinase
MPDPSEQARTDSSGVRAAIYNRISQDRTGERAAVTRQLEDARRLAELHGWATVEPPYVDNSISAYKRSTRRPGYERMVEDYRAGHFDAIITYDLDRLTRQPRQLEDWIDESETRGLRLVTTNGEADLSTDAGRLFARIKVAVGRSEMERKGARQKRAIQQRVEHGKVLAGVRLTGYDDKGQVIEDEAAIVRDVFRRFAAGESLKGISRLLDAEGIPTRRGGTWNSSTVLSILRNPRYAGRAVYKGKATGHAGQWTAVVDEAVFDAVQARLTDPQRTTNREGTARKWLGSGLFRCAVCDGKVRTNGMQYWCPKGGHVARGMKPVDDLILDIVRARLLRPDVLRAFVIRDDAAAAELNQRADSLRSRLATIESDYDAGDIDGRRFKVANERVQAELDAVQNERAKLLGNSTVAAVLATNDPAAMFDNASLDSRRAVIDALMVVRLNPTHRGTRGFDPESVLVEWRDEVKP